MGLAGLRRPLLRRGPLVQLPSHTARRLSATPRTRVPRRPARARRRSPGMPPELAARSAYGLQHCSSLRLSFFDLSPSSGLYSAFSDHRLPPRFQTMLFPLDLTIRHYGPLLRPRASGEHLSDHPYQNFEFHLTSAHSVGLHDAAFFGSASRRDHRASKRRAFHRLPAPLPVNNVFDLSARRLLWAAGAPPTFPSPTSESGYADVQVSDTQWAYLYSCEYPVWSFRSWLSWCLAHRCSPLSSSRTPEISTCQEASSSASYTASPPAPSTDRTPPSLSPRPGYEGWLCWYDLDETNYCMNLSCPYEHPVSWRSRTFCKHYYNGVCARGRACWFLHDYSPLQASRKRHRD